MRAAPLTLCLALASLACGQHNDDRPPPAPEPACQAVGDKARVACADRLWACSSSTSYPERLAGCARSQADCMGAAGLAEAACWDEAGLTQDGQRARCLASCDFDAYDCEAFVLRMLSWPEADRVDAACSDARGACEDACR